MPPRAGAAVGQPKLVSNMISTAQHGEGGDIILAANESENQLKVN